MGKSNLQPRQRGVNPNRLQPTHRRFADAYLANGLKGAEAAREVGYAHPAVSAAKLLKNPLVKAYIEKSLSESENAKSLTREVVLEQLLYAITRKGADFVDAKGEILPVHKMSDLAQSCIDGFEQEVFENAETGDRRIKTKLKLSPKAPAIDMGMKYLQLFGKNEGGNAGGVQVNINLGEMLSQSEAARKMIVDDSIIEGRVSPSTENANGEMSEQ